jgi:DNA-binding MarR family transcriptional regulator
MRERKPVDLLHAAAIELLRRVAGVDQESGLSAARLSALAVLEYGGATTLGGLAAAERVTAPTMTRIVDGLERDGLVRRGPHPDDRRAVRVVLTPRGRDSFERARRRRLDLLDHLFAEATPAEHATLRRAAEIVERCLARAPVNGETVGA